MPRKVEKLDTWTLWGRITQNILETLKQKRSGVTICQIRLHLAMPRGTHKRIRHRLVHRSILMSAGWQWGLSEHLVSIYKYVGPPNPRKSHGEWWKWWIMIFPVAIGSIGHFGQTIEVRPSFTLDDVVAQIQDGKIGAPHCSCGSWPK